MKASYMPRACNGSPSGMTRGKSDYILLLHVLERRGSTYKWNIVRPKDWPRRLD